MAMPNPYSQLFYHQPTNFYGAACGSSSAQTQYINNCDYHGAYHTLNTMYNGTLTMPTGSEVLAPLLEYEQGEFGGKKLVITNIRW